MLITDLFNTVFYGVAKHFTHQCFVLTKCGGGSLVFITDLKTPTLGGGGGGHFTHL